MGYGSIRRYQWNLSHASTTNALANDTENLLIPTPYDGETSDKGASEAEKSEVLDCTFSDSHEHYKDRSVLEHPNWSWVWLPMQIIILFLAGLVVLVPYTIVTHDVGTATGLCVLVWTVGGGVYSIPKMEETHSTTAR